MVIDTRHNNCVTVRIDGDVTKPSGGIGVPDIIIHIRDGPDSHEGTTPDAQFRGPGDAVGQNGQDVVGSGQLLPLLRWRPPDLQEREGKDEGRLRLGSPRGRDDGREVEVKKPASGWQ